MRTRLWVLVGFLTVNGCGSPNSASGPVGPTGGEVCLPDRRACIQVPLQALDKQTRITIEVIGDVPPATVGEGFEISTVDGPIVFKARATVTLKYDPDHLPEDGGLNPSLLRVHTLSDAGRWVPLDDSVTDRAQARISGKTWHLSPFLLLRTDRLPDGGLPIEIDGGPIVPPPPPPPPPPFDASRPDAGYDAGRPDAGYDAGRPDAGFDAGRPDAGFDAGRPDAGVDAGFDAGTPDAGVDAGYDAGAPDAGVDAGTPDAGADAGAPDDGGTDAGDGG